MEFRTDDTKTPPKDFFKKMNNNFKKGKLGMIWVLPPPPPKKTPRLLSQLSTPLVFSPPPAPGGFPGKLLEILGTGNLLKNPPSPAPEGGAATRAAASSPAHGINQGEVAVGLEKGGISPQNLPIPRDADPCPARQVQPRRFECPKARFLAPKPQ